MNGSLLDLAELDNELIIIRDTFKNRQEAPRNTKEKYKPRVIFPVQGIASVLSSCDSVNELSECELILCFMIRLEG